VNVLADVVCVVDDHTVPLWVAIDHFAAAPVNRRIEWMTSCVAWIAGPSVASGVPSKNWYLAPSAVMYQSIGSKPGELMISASDEIVSNRPAKIRVSGTLAALAMLPRLTVTASPPGELIVR
jgi:hypothetical protein